MDKLNKKRNKGVSFKNTGLDIHIEKSIFDFLETKFLGANHD